MMNNEDFRAWVDCTFPHKLVQYFSFTQFSSKSPFLFFTSRYLWPLSVPWPGCREHFAGLYYESLTDSDADTSIGTASMMDWLSMELICREHPAAAEDNKG